MARPSHRAAFAVCGLIEPVCLDKPVCCFAILLTDISHRLACRAVVCVGLLIVVKVVGVERILSVLLVRSLLVEVVVFDERRDATLLKKVVVLFAPISGIRCQALGRLFVSFDIVFDVIF